MDKVKIGDIVRTQYDDYGKIVQEAPCFYIGDHKRKMYEVRPLFCAEGTEWLYDDEIVKCSRLESIWQRILHWKAARALFEKLKGKS